MRDLGKCLDNSLLGTCYYGYVTYYLTHKSRNFIHVHIETYYVMQIALWRETNGFHCVVFCRCRILREFWDEEEPWAILSKRRRRSYQQDSIPNGTNYCMNWIGQGLVSHRGNCVVSSLVPFYYKIYKCGFRVYHFLTLWNLRVLKNHRSLIQCDINIDQVSWWSKWPLRLVIL